MPSPPNPPARGAPEPWQHTPANQSLARSGGSLPLRTLVSNPRWRPGIEISPRFSSGKTATPRHSNTRSRPHSTIRSMAKRTTPLARFSKPHNRSKKPKACFRLALETDRENPAYHTNLAGALVDAGKLNQAQYHYQQAIQLNAMLPDAHHGLGMLQLQTGNLEAGWKNYEWRWQTAQQNKRRHRGKPSGTANRLRQNTVRLLRTGARRFHPVRPFPHPSRRARRLNYPRVPLPRRQTCSGLFESNH